MLAVDWFVAVFRIVHILAGVFWVGSVFLLVMFVQPSAAAIAPAGAPFMTELLGKRRLIDRIIGLAVITIAAGLVLYWHDWHLVGSFGDWIGSHFGATLTVGMLAAIGALAIGLAVTRPNLVRFLAIGRQVAESGAPPSPEVAAEMGAIQTRLRNAARASLVLLVVAVLAMSTARYL
jgi:uncharacterized membrane protein